MYSSGLLPDGENLVFVIRGDIISTTGYARAARALADILAEKYRVLGVSMHEDPADRSVVFPGDLICDADLRALACSERLIIINHTTPDQFLPIPEAINVGLFYWETTAIPRKLFWPEYISTMDAIWAPTRFVAQFVKSCGFDGPVTLVPWPHSFDQNSQAQRTADKSEIVVELLSTMAQPDEEAFWQTASVAELQQSGRDIYLAIQSLSPRKGLPVLISEWHRYVQETPKSNSVLLLKLNFRHAYGITADSRQYFNKLLGRYGVGPGALIRIGLITQHLTDDDMEALIAHSSALVSATYGEGFGGPIVEALNVGTPVIASRHTGIADLIPADYRLQFASRELHVQLRDLILTYPSSSSWFVPEFDALRSAFASFSMMSMLERADILRNGREHAQNFCETGVVRQILEAAIAELVSRVSA